MKVQKQENLLEVLKKLAPDSSTSTLRSWIQKGRVLIAGQRAKAANQMVERGQEVILAPTLAFLPADIKVLYSDSEIVVIEKPYGLLSVATAFQKEHTAHHILKKNFHPKQVFPVHRLDKDTSGVMIFALTTEARNHFKQAFMEKTVEKRYVALCEGTFHQKTGSWESFLEEDETYFVRAFADPDKGKKATTHFKVLYSNPRFTLLDLTLETGRKNQLRVHCSAAGHPISGDKKYGAKTNSLKRLCLHAYYLAFVHPKTKKKLTFKIPFPEDFAKKSQ